MDISNLISNINSQLNGTNKNGGAKVGTDNNTQSSSAQKLGLLSELTKGSVFEGSIVKIENGKAVISLADGSNLTAKIDAGVALKQGIATFFEVKNNENGLITLKTVTQSMANNPTLIKALNYADVAVTDRNLELVRDMMKVGLPIDGKNLSNLARIANQFQDINTQTIVDLKKLGVDITPQNIEQLEHYKGGEGQMQGNLESIAKEMASLPSQMENPKDAMQVHQQLSAMILESEVEETADNETQKGTMQTDGMPKEGIAEEAGKNAIENENTAKSIISEEGIIKDATGQAQEGIIKDATGQAQEGISGRQGMENITIGSNNTEAESQNAVENKAFAGNDGQVAGQIFEEASGQIAKQNTEQVSGKVTGQVTEQVAEQLKEGLNAKTAADVISFLKNIPTDTSSKDVLKQLSMILQQNNLDETEIKELFSSKEYKSLMNDALEKQWFIRPEELADKDKRNQLYERINKQMSKLSEIMQSTRMDHSDVAKQITDTRNNLNFTNEINHLYQYVQIPLKMANQNATGDLYVYTDKKSLRNKKGDISAHLHLEMEHLGTTDVFVRLNGKKVSTNFMMEDDMALDLVLAHIDELTARLNRRGFEVKIDASKMNLNDSGAEDNRPDFVKEILGIEHQNDGLISRYSFDVSV